MKRLIAAATLVLFSALPSAAQQLTLQIENGRVTLDAVDVPAQQILAEWARVGGTKVVGAEKITGPPLTLHLVDTPESQALDIILRNVAGFMAAPRAANSAPGKSAFDRILVMATTSVPPPPPANARTVMPGAGNGQRRFAPRPPNLPPSMGDDPAADQVEIADDQVDTGVPEPVFTFPAPQDGVPTGNPVYIPAPGGTPAFGTPATGVTAPVITLQPGPNGPTIYNFVPTNPAQPADQTQQPPNTGFGIFGAQTPGMIQVPQPAPGQPVQGQPQQQPPRTRPPG